jgi:hypothetical protein
VKKLQGTQHDPETETYMPVMTPVALQMIPLQRSAHGSLADGVVVELEPPVELVVPELEPESVQPVMLATTPAVLLMTSPTCSLSLSSTPPVKLPRPLVAVRSAW